MYFSMLESITLVLYIEDIVFIGSNKPKVANKWRFFVRYMCSRGWEINFMKINHYIGEIVKSQIVWVMPRHHLQRKGEIISSLFPNHEERRTMFGRHFQVLGHHIPHLGILLQSVYYVIWNSASFERAKNRKGLCSKSRLQCKQPCHLDHKTWQILW